MPSILVHETDIRRRIEEKLAEKKQALEQAQATWEYVSTVSVVADRAERQSSDLAYIEKTYGDDMNTLLDELDEIRKNSFTSLANDKKEKRTSAKDSHPDQTHWEKVASNSKDSGPEDSDGQPDRLGDDEVEEQKRGSVCDHDAMAHSNSKDLDSATRDDDSNETVNKDAGDLGLHRDDISTSHLDEVHGTNGLDCNQEDSDNENSDNETEDYLDLSNDELREEVARVKKSKLRMAIQGLRSTGRYQYGKVIEEDWDDTERHKRAKLAEIDSVNLGERTLCRGSCYHYDVGQGKIQIIVGIVRFLSEIEAECVLIVPFEETFLGIEDEDVEYEPSYRPASYFQVREPIDPLPLEKIGHPCKDPATIPSHVYEPQAAGSWYCFAYLSDIPKKRFGKRDEMRVLELFAGAGGMSQGFAKEGFNIVKAVEKEPIAVETYAANNAHSAVVQTSVQDFLYKFKKEDYRRQIGRIDHTHASSPCQGFSGANRMGGKNDKANNDLCMTFVEDVRIGMPDTASFENVVGMWRRKHLHYLKNILVELMKLGYQVRCSRLVACDYGDPQARPRIFLFAARHNVPLPMLPQKTHGTGIGQLPFVTVKDALEDLRGLAGRCDLPNMGRATSRLQVGQHGVIRLQADALAPTITATSAPPFHYCEDRCITVREAAALQSLPNDYIIFGNLREQYKQVGNAVPVELARAVARSIRLSLDYRYTE
jgi:DNA (cytosine-5)-methyltransferase 1